MKANYDPEVDVLSIAMDLQPETSASLLDYPDIVVDLAESNGHEIVGLTVMGASMYLPLNKGYDPIADTLLLGAKADSPELSIESGPFIGYWQVYEDEPDSFMDPVGVLIRDASKHLGSVLAQE